MIKKVLKWIAVGLAMSVAGDAEPVHEVGSYLALWTKDTDGSWKIAVDMWNSDRSPAMTGDSQ